MQKLLKNTSTVILFFSILLLCSACNTEKEKHLVSSSGVEWGVSIEVMLKGGGTAILICPKFSSKPAGSHGRECYLDRYDYKED